MGRGNTIRMKRREMAAMEVMKTSRVARLSTLGVPKALAVMTRISEGTILMRISLMRWKAP
jgi:hypothetical protein